ncbi:hypothetical protein [Rossellomorea aquimaris]|uniref:hypothetical protein n=1 Tax=Rossellomorea aquimaris TaxID=189382 RepID=UPI0007D04C19|nr:hypothetical protein [Rossellomorea aquimaris]
MNQQWYTIGSFTFPASWAAIIISFVITFLFLYFWNRKASDWYSNAIFYFILVWKLSVILVDFQTVLAHPITILYFHGGVIGYALGILAVLLYTFFKKENPYYVIVGWVTTALVYETVMQLLQEEYILGGIQLLVNLSLLFILIKGIKLPRKKEWAFQLLILFTLGQILFQAFRGIELNISFWTNLIIMTSLIYLLKSREETQ